MKGIISLVFFCLIGMTGTTQEVKVSSGTVKRFINFKSKFVDARTIDVWLPEGYSNKKKYAVLYMQDGQMLYDASTTWNKQAWEVDSIAGKLIKENKVAQFIVVGIWNNDKKRHPEYFPEKPYESLSNDQKNTITSELQKAGRTTEVFKPISDNYLKFLVTELKPFIDQNFDTKKDMYHTFIAGSSMGALLSMYAICEYPNVFGGAICMSTHWPGTFSVENNPIPDAFVNYLKTHLPNPKKHTIYFDYGDKTLDALYKPLQEKVDLVMISKGFTKDNWITKFYLGQDHSEKSWRERLTIPLLFLLKK
jgi:enterochelin esterase-like enzyme